ncbi:MAG: hypothetical protein WDN31_02175 [Hyphomicrobium sp.]
MLLAERKSWALDQSDVGAVLGASADAIGNYERGYRSPALALLLGLELLYGKPIAVLFPETLQAAATRIVDGAQELSIRIEGQADRAALRKQEFLRALGDRLVTLLGA